MALIVTERLRPILLKVGTIEQLERAVGATSSITARPGLVDTQRQPTRYPEGGTDFIVASSREG